MSGQRSPTSIQLSRVSAHIARTIGRQLRASGKIRTTFVRRLISSFQRSSMFAERIRRWCCRGSRRNANFSSTNRKVSAATSATSTATRPSAIAFNFPLLAVILGTRRQQPHRADRRGRRWKNCVKYSIGWRIRGQATRRATTFTRC